MYSVHRSSAPHWYAIPLRVAVLTFIGTLLCFSVILLFAIFGTVILAALRGMHPDMRIAYRHIALPLALVAGSIVFLLVLAMEIRHYQQSKALSLIERTIEEKTIEERVIKRRSS